MATANGGGDYSSGAARRGWNDGGGGDARAEAARALRAFAADGT